MKITRCKCGSVPAFETDRKELLNGWSYMYIWLECSCGMATKRMQIAYDKPEVKKMIVKIWNNDRNNSYADKQSEGEKNAS